MDDGDNGQLLDMDSSDQQTSQIDSEMDSQQSSSQDCHHHHHHLRHTETGDKNDLNPLAELVDGNLGNTKKRQSTESNSSSIVGKYWRSKSLPVAYLPPLQSTDQITHNSSQTNSASPHSQGKDSCKTSSSTTCKNCRGSSTRKRPNCGGVGVDTGRCSRCRGSHGSATPQDSVNNGKVKCLGGGSSAEQVPKKANRND